MDNKHRKLFVVIKRSNGANLCLNAPNTLGGRAAFMLAEELLRSARPVAAVGDLVLTRAREEEGVRRCHGHVQL